MKIGIMLRSLDEKGGIGVYTKNLIEELINIDNKNQYVFFYKNKENIGKYSSYKNVKEVTVNGNNKLYWDQIAVAQAGARENVDVLFNPKFTIPLFGKFKKMMVVHGADWFIPEHAKFYNKWDVKYIKFMMPKYLKASDKVLSVSEITTENFNKILNLPSGKVKTVYFGPAKFFKRIDDQNEIQNIKDKYALPEKFILSLSRYGFGGGMRKNIDKLFAAIKLVYEKNKEIKFVIGGKNIDKYIEDLNLKNEKFIENIIFPGWIDQQDLPAIYSSCEMYLYPSNVEAFPIPLTEAMTCGTPIITSDANGLREIAGDAALFVDQENETEISKAIFSLLNNSDLKKELSEKGLKRSKIFSWEKCGRETLEAIEQVVLQQGN
jgi:glycosyltransferase involved in cell wall biosynthesis